MLVVRMTTVVKVMSSNPTDFLDYLDVLARQAVEGIALDNDNDSDDENQKQLGSHLA